MSGFVPSMHRRQQFLLPDVVDDYVSEENPVRFIDVFVDAMDLVTMGFVHAEPNEMGRPPYNPADLLKLYLYGYLNHLRSSRRLERECQRNLEVIWLMRKLAPDFKTIADFRAINADRIRSVFREMVKLCHKLDLLDHGLVAVDGSKFRAVNSIDRHFTPEILDRKLAELDERVKRYLKELDENDAREATEAPFPYPVKNLKEAITALQEKQQSLRDLRSRMEATGEKGVSLTDPDSRVMKSHGMLEMCYNTQIAVEAKNKIIVEYEVDNKASDHHQLAPMATRAREVLGVERLKVTADKGYYDGDQVRRCVEDGITPYLPRPEKAKGSGERAEISPEFYKDKFRYDASTDTIVCPVGQRLTPGSLCQKRWPQRPDGVSYKVYRTNACQSCPEHMTRCTRNPQGRMIHRSEHETVLEAMNTRMHTEDGRKIIGLQYSATG
jgi:transposase